MVDYVGMKKTFYSAEGDMVVTPINYEGLPPVAPEFSLEAVRADILDSQRNGQKYRDFTRRAMEAGVQGYFAFLRGKRVTYFGRQGDAAHGMVSKIKKSRLYSKFYIGAHPCLSVVKPWHFSTTII